MLKLDNADAERMKEIERELVKALLPYATGARPTEAGLAVFALVRCARTLLRKYPKRAQEDLLDAVVPFLEGKTEPRRRPGRGPTRTDSGLILTDGFH